jgi:NAD(P)-dependent dehydrogenase (short-subunit alcohol dehydrogenase family)
VSSERLDGRVVLVSGAAGELGAAACALFAEHGAIVAAVDEVQPDVSGIPRARAWACEGYEDRSVAAVVAAVRSELGPIAVTYNDTQRLASSNGRADAEDGDLGVLDLDLESFEEVLDAVLKSAYLFSKHSIPQMIEQGGGSIVNVASLEGTVLGGRDHALATAHGGLLGLTRAIASTYGQQGVRANAICRTPVGVDLAASDRDADPLMQSFRAGGALGRVGRPEEIAQVALFLASEASSLMTGAVIRVDGGVTLQ